MIIDRTNIALLVVLAALTVVTGVALAQVPIPVQEQIRLFNSMSPAQQQALIRELQRSLPPAQRQAIVGMLQGDGAATEPEDVDLESEAVLADAVGAQGGIDDEMRAGGEPRLRPGDSLVIQFQQREDDPRALQRTPDEREELAEFLERPQLAGHRGLADADVGGELGRPLAAALIQTDQQPVGGRLQVGVDRAGHLPLAGAGAAQQHRQLAFQREEAGLLHIGRGPRGGGGFPAAVCVIVHVCPCLGFPF